MDTKRTYIRRKRCLSEITSTIKNALIYIAERSNSEMTEEMIDQLAHQHSSAIEAACWFPKQHMTESEYSNLLMGKAKLLCQALISSKVPICRTQVIPTSLPPKLSATPPPQMQIKRFPSHPVIQTKPPPLAPGAFSEPEAIDQPPAKDKKEKFYSCSPMSASELHNFLEKGTFSFSSMTENSIPPLVERKSLQ